MPEAKKEKDLNKPFVPENHFRLPPNDPTQLASLNFSVLDVETATPQRHSICQIAICTVRDGQILGTKSWYVRPPNNEYNDFNRRIHHISPKQTADAPDFAELWQDELKGYLDGELILAHNAAFDIDCLQKVLAYYDIPQPILWFGCTVQFFRALMAGLPNYKLSTLCELFEIPLNHHDASSDAEATAQLILKLAEKNIITANDEFYKKTGYEWGRLTTFDYMPTFYRKYVRPDETLSGMWEGSMDRLEERDTDGSIKSPKLQKETKPLPESEQKLKGLTVVVTGELKKYLRSEIMALIEQHGGKVASSVSKKVNLVIVGIQISSNVDGSGLSRKEQKAKELKSLGHAIHIIDEPTFDKILEIGVYAIESSVQSV